MSKQLAKDGYSLVATHGGYGRLAQEYPHQFTAVKNTHGLPAGFIPGADECEEKGYNYGSEITTVDGSLFKCVDPTSRKAVWIEISTVVTDRSYIAEVDSEPVAEPTIEEKVVQAESGGVASQADEVNRDRPLGELTAIPFVGQMVRDQSINTLGDLIDAANEGRVADISYMNDDRAKKVVAYLKEQDYI